MRKVTHTHSYYAATVKDISLRPQLDAEVSTDICIIGAGFTGLSTAIHLAEKGYHVIVLEGKRIGFGASGRNGGQIVHSYSRDIDFIEKHYGEETGAAMGNMAFEGAKILRRFVSQYHVDCDLKSGGIFAACNKKQFDGLRNKKALWGKYGNTSLELLSSADLPNYIGSQRYEGALLDNSGGHFHPLNLALGEAAALESLGGHIYEDSEVLAVEKGKKVVVKTAKGSVSAKFVVVAGNAYLGGLVPKLKSKAMPCGSQIICTQQLSQEQQETLLPGEHCVEDCNYLLDYFRLTGDGRLLYGGGVTYGARKPGKIESLLVPNMLKTFPQLKGIKIDYAWTGNFLLTLMRLPQFGRVDDNIYYAQGYSGHGVTASHLAGCLLSEVISGQAERFDVVASLPQYPFPGGRVFRIPYTSMGAWYYDLRDKLGI